MKPKILDEEKKRQNLSSAKRRVTKQSINSMQREGNTLAQL